MEQEEQVVAVLPEVVEGKTVAEAEMSKEVTAVEAQAGQITIASQSDYEQAAAFGRLIKQKSAQIIDFFAPMKKAAHEAHQNICTREKEMLAPLISAEKTVKQIMGDYVMEQERKRREEEERLKRLAEEEAEIEGRKKIKAVCQDCGASSPIFDFRSQAVEYWNERAIPELQNEVLYLPFKRAIELLREVLQNRINIE